MSHHLIVQPDISINKMKRLTDILRKNGFSYTLILREGRTAIYRQQVTEKLAYFEVFVVKVKPEQNLFGKFYPEREVFPSDDCFGKSGWSFRNLEDAMKRYKKLIEEGKLKK